GRDQPRRGKKRREGEKEGEKEEEKGPSSTSTSEGDITNKQRGRGPEGDITNKQRGRGPGLSFSDRGGHMVDTRQSDEDEDEPRDDHRRQ
ncbi:MAG: hypothetical protein ABI333_02310, partial [bacterium]